MGAGTGERLRVLFPIGDENPARRTAVVTYSLIALNVVVFVLINLRLGLTGGLEVLEEAFAAYGFLSTEPFSWHLLSSLFLHADPLHLLGNMWVLWIVGDNVEDKLGRVGFGALYLVGGVLASWAFVGMSAFAPADGDFHLVPLIGASGAIFAVMGVYLVFFPEARIRLLLLIPAHVFRVRAKWIIGAWFVQDFALTVLARGPSHGSVATAAHLGGALMGIAAGTWLKPHAGGGKMGDAWDAHTGFARRAADRHLARFVPRWRKRKSVDMVESDLIAVEEDLVRAVHEGRTSDAVRLYPIYERAMREQPLPGAVQIEIAHEFFRRGRSRDAYEAYQRYLETEPRGEDQAEAHFRVGVLLARSFRRDGEARAHLEAAAAEHGDERIRAFAARELARAKDVPGEPGGGLRSAFPRPRAGPQIC